MNVYLPFTARLPSAYQEVEYIQSTGNQYIDTGYKYNGTYFRIDFKLLYNSYSWGGEGANLPTMTGVIGRSYGNMFMSLNPDTHKFGFATGTQYETDVVAQLGTIYETMLEYKSGTMNMKINNSEFSTSSSGTFYTGKSIPIFCRWDIQYSGLYSYFTTDVKLYNCKIYSAENVLVRNFIPCYRKSDSVIGMYDLVNNQFYTNQGTGTFSKGNDVTMSELKNAYIGKVYEYSYNFVGKTVAQIQSDGWTTAQGTPTIGTYGYSSANSNRARSNFTLPSLATARKITFYTNIIFTSSTGATDTIRLSTTSRTNMTGYYLDNVGNGQAQIGGDNISFSATSGAGAYKMTVELDFQNSTYKYSLTGHNDIIGTLTSSQISNIRNCTVAEAMSDGNTGYIKDFKLIVEY